MKQLGKLGFIVPTIATLGFDECHEKNLKAMMRFAVGTHVVSLESFSNNLRIFDANGYARDLAGTPRVLPPMKIQVSATMDREELAASGYGGKGAPGTQRSRSQPPQVYRDEIRGMRTWTQT